MQRLDPPRLEFDPISERGSTSGTQKTRLGFYPNPILGIVH